MTKVTLAQDMPPMNTAFAMAGICTDQQYLYAVAGGKITQYLLTDMSLVKTVDLPDPGPPPAVSASDMDTVPPQSGKMPPPHFGKSQWLLANGGYLYIMMGPMIYRYSASGLTLQSSTELPKPEGP